MKIIQFLVLFVSLEESLRFHPLNWKEAASDPLFYFCSVG